MKTLQISAALVAAWLGSAHAQSKFVVDAKLANPTKLPAVSGKTGTWAFDMGFKCNSYLTSKPVAVLDVKGVPKLSISVRGVRTFAVKIGNGGLCKGSSPLEVSFDEWPDGRVEIYLGDDDKDVNLKATIQIDDLARPAKLDWDDVEHVKIDGAPAKPVLVHADIGGKERSEVRGISGCQLAYREKPDVVLDVSKSTSSLQVHARGLDSDDIMLVGPVDGDTRRLRMQCQSDTKGSFSVEPGVYGIKVGDHGKATLLNIAIFAKDAKPDGTLLAKVPEKVALAERDVLLHYPQLTLDALLTSDELRGQIFATAPKQLFAYVKTDLSEGGSYLKNSVGDSGDKWPDDKAPAIDYPKANEPVLVVGDAILTADGLVFGANAKSVAEAPAGALAWPDKARDPQASFVHSHSNTGPEDAKAVAAYEAARKKYDACSIKIEGPIADKMLAMQANGLTASEEQQIAAMQVQTRKRVEAACKPQALAKLRDATWTSLIKSRTARREKLLSAARARFAEGQ